MTTFFLPETLAENCGTYPDPSSGFIQGAGLTSPRAYAISNYVDTIGGGLGPEPTIAADIDDTGAAVDGTQPTFELRPVLLRMEGGVPVMLPRGELTQGYLGAPVWLKVAVHEPEWVPL